MFGMEPGRESGGDGAGGGTVLMRFVWPHGGRSVFLSGSFDRWTRLVPMSPIEGSPTFFQAICSVAPGFHQYKFLVDGEWRHADGQPCSPSEFGIVNTVLVTGDANFNPMGSPSQEMPLSMDVDTETFRRVVHISEGSVSDFMPRISEADLQLSRHRVSTYMSSQTAYELLPTSGKAVALDIDLPVKQAFHILHEEGISVAPLWDASKSQFTGMLSASDFILILTELGKRGSNLTEEELDTHTISAWKEGKAYLNRQVDGHGRALPRRLVYAGPYDNLKDVSLRILQNEVASIPILHSENGSFAQLLHVASLSEVLYSVCRYFKHCSGTLPVLQWPICAIPIGTWVPKIGESNRRPLAMLRPHAPLSSALNLLIEARVSTIPIVDDNDSLVDVYCRSDITALAKDRLYTHININEMTVHQALQFGQDVFEMRSQRCQMCLPSDTLHKVMERLSNPGVRRLIIVEAGSKRVEGIVTLSDVFRFLLG